MNGIKKKIKNNDPYVPINADFDGNRLYHLKMNNLGTCISNTKEIEIDIDEHKYKLYAETT